MRVYSSAGSPESRVGAKEGSSDLKYFLSAGKTLLWQVLQVARCIVSYVHLCLMGAALACVGASFGNNPFIRELLTLHISIVILRRSPLSSLLFYKENARSVCQTISCSDWHAASLQMVLVLLARCLCILQRESQVQKYLHFGVLLLARLLCHCLISPPNAEGEYEDWLLDTVGLFVWIVAAGIAYYLGRLSWWCWCSIKEDPRMAKSLSKQDLFTL